MTEDEVWDSALDAVIEMLGDIETSVHGVMPTAAWLQVVRMRVMLMRNEAEVDVDEERLTAVEEEIVLLRQAIADLHQAILDATSHKDMQASVAELSKSELEA